MDKIWDRNLSKSEVIGHCGGDEKTNDNNKRNTISINEANQDKYSTCVICI